MLHQLKQIPTSIQLGGNYALAASILFTPPVIPNDIGHYTAAIRFNSNWEVFDDLRNSTYTISDSTDICVHCLVYIKL